MDRNKRLRIYLAIATIGRAQILCQTLNRLTLQTRRPDGVIVVGTREADTFGVRRATADVEVLTSAKGLCRQRNAALDHLAGRADVVIFIDDDFLPANDYVAQVEESMRSTPDLVGLTGHLLADGAHTGEISVQDALGLLTAPKRTTDKPSHETNWLYGCNMAIRISAAPDLRFDERLPLYGWQEDVDFSCRLGRHGRMMRMRELTGVHLGTRSGRISGVRFGYSQIANILYLRGKNTIGARHGFGLMARNVGSNLARSLWSEPDIDRRGRLAGNALGLIDMLRGRIDPSRVERL